MQLNERFRQFPIKFYKTKNGEVEYESGFTIGKSPNLNSAFKEFDNETFVRDLLYYYDDVVDIEYGTFEPALKPTKYKGREYLGRLILKLDLNDYDGPTTVKYLNKNRKEIPSHLNRIQKMKDAENQVAGKEKLQQSIDSIFKKVINMFNKNKNEMFSPLKTTEQKICVHCGKNIPMGSYYETYRNQNYHLECIWDKLTGGHTENSYEDARKYFFSLQEYIGNWPPYGLDVEEDYLLDLDLVKHNDRTVHNETLECTLRKLNSRLRKTINESI